MFISSMGYLTARMGAELLLHDKTEKRQKVLKWIWSGDHWQRHEGLRKTRVSGTGNRILGSVEAWINRRNSGPLICEGIRKTTRVTC